MSASISGRNLNPSQAELFALRAVIEEGSIRGAAASLYLSPHTVDAHIDNLRLKSGKRTLAQIVYWAMRNGWLEIIPMG